MLSVVKAEQTNASKAIAESKEIAMRTAKEMIQVTSQVHEATTRALQKATEENASWRSTEEFKNKTVREEMIKTSNVTMERRIQEHSAKTISSWSKAQEFINLSDTTYGLVSSMNEIKKKLKDIEESMKERQKHDREDREGQEQRQNLPYPRNGEIDTPFCWNCRREGRRRRYSECRAHNRYVRERYPRQFQARNFQDRREVRPRYPQERRIQGRQYYAPRTKREFNDFSDRRFGEPVWREPRERARPHYYAQDYRDYEVEYPRDRHFFEEERRGNFMGAPFARGRMRA